MVSAESGVPMPVRPPGVPFSLDAGQWHFSSAPPAVSKERDMWVAIPSGVVRQRIGHEWVDTGFTLGGSDPGSGSDAHFVHVQEEPATIWTCHHNLGKKPAVEVFDSAGDRCFGHVAFPTLNTTVLTFSAAFSGEAIHN